jgi:hypothetical protein
MVYNTQWYWVFGLCPSSGFFLNNNEKTERFGNWICFRNVVFFSCYLGKIRTMNKVRKPNISVYVREIFPQIHMLMKSLLCSKPIRILHNNVALLQLTCTVKATNKKRSIPVIVRVSDNNDNAPYFENTPYETTVSEVSWPHVLGSSHLVTAHRVWTMHFCGRWWFSIS